MAAEGGEGASESSFGPFLRLRREKLGLTRQEVAAELRLTGTTVQWLEEGNLARLPAEVYVKGFLREYAKLVSADPEHVLALYLQSPGRKVPVDELKRRPSRHKRFVLLAVLVLAILAVVFLARAMADKPEARVPESFSPPKAAEALAASAPELIELRVQAEKDAIIKVMADEGPPVSHLLSPGESLRLSARKSLNLLLADPDAVKIFRDGAPVALDVRQGQPANLRIH